MEKLKMESADLTEQNIDKIGALFPNVITETKDADGKLKKAINFTLLQQMLQSDLVEGDECYDFTWVGKKQSLIDGNKPIRKTLRPCVEESKNWNETENLYIEGDNLEVLKLLQGSYLNSIKMMYFDPPYNTGNDFVYRDNFTINKEDYEDDLGMFDEDNNRLFQNNESNGRFHSDWCSMMYPRLQLARNLLTDDGVIFISIDDSEVDNLRKICDEVFGEDNFRNQILVRRRVKSLNVQFADNGLYSFNVGFEYILVYAKSNRFLFKAIRSEKEIKPTKGSWNVFWSNADRVTMRYELLGFTPSTGQWRWSKGKAEEAISNYQNYIKNFSNTQTLEEYWEKTGERLKFIRRIPDGFGKNGGVQYWVSPSDSSLRTSNWTDIEVSQIKKDFDLPFENPKNVDLIKEIIKSYDEANIIVCDIFSGSATTADAIFRLNAEDSGNRKFIMVQLPETCDENIEAYKVGEFKNICEIGKERIRRAGQKIEAEQKEKTSKDGLFQESVKQVDTGFRVLKLDSTNMKDVYYGAGEYNQQMLLDLESNIKNDRTDLDLLYGILLDWGVSLALPHTNEMIGGVKVHFVNGADLVACFADNVNETVIRGIAKRKPLRVVFRDSSFANSPDKINVTEIFKTISPETTVKVI